MQPHHNVSSRNIAPRAFSGRVYICLQNKRSPWPRVPPDMHVPVLQGPQLLRNCYLQNVGQEWEDVGWGSTVTPSSPLCSFPTAFLSLLSLFKPPLSFKVLPRSLPRPLLLLQPLLEGPPPCSPPYIFSLPSRSNLTVLPRRFPKWLWAGPARPPVPSIYILSSSFSPYFLSSPWLD